MRRMLALMLALFTIAAQAAPYFMDGNALYAGLQRQDPAASSYIFGVYDGVQITQYHAPSGDRIICTPAAVAGTELVDAVRGYLEVEPSILSYPAVVVVLRAFIWAFPCDRA